MLESLLLAAAMASSDDKSGVWTEVDISVKVEILAVSPLRWKFSSKNPRVNSGEFTGKENQKGFGDITLNRMELANINFTLGDTSAVKSVCNKQIGSKYDTVFGENLSSTDGMTITGAPPSEFIFIGPSKESRSIKLIDTNHTPATYAYQIDIFCIGRKNPHASVKFSTDPKIKNGGGALCGKPGQPACR